MTTKTENPDHDLGWRNGVPVLDEVSLWAAPFGLRLLDTVKYRQSLRVLDVGTGTGFPLNELAMRLGSSSQVCGVDPWMGCLERAKSKQEVCGISNAYLVRGIAERLPFREKTFDLIVSNNGINNVADVDKVIAEIGRVAKTGAQFIFTFNTERTFINFYEIFREVLYREGIPDVNYALRKHIAEKRKPVLLMEKLVRNSGFKITMIKEDSFYYHFSNGTAMLNHFFIRMAFSESWRNLVPQGKQDVVFSGIEKKLNDIAGEAGVLEMEVPFVIFDCERV